MKQKYLQIPLRFRAAFYCAPVFISWLAGYSVETDPRALRASGRGLVLFCFFLLLRGLLLVVHEVTKSFALYGYGPDMVFFALKSAIGLGYLGVSCYFAIGEIRDRPALHESLDSFAQRLNGFLSR